MDEEESSANEDVYEVEQIVDVRLDQVGRYRLYRVRWKGCDEDHDTWEPKENLLTCDDLLKAFEEKKKKKKKKRIEPAPPCVKEEPNESESDDDNNKKSKNTSSFSDLDDPDLAALKNKERSSESMTRRQRKEYEKLLRNDQTSSNNKTSLSSTTEDISHTSEESSPQKRKTSPHKTISKKKKDMTPSIVVSTDTDQSDQIVKKKKIKALNKLSTDTDTSEPIVKKKKMKALNKLSTDTDTSEPIVQKKKKKKSNTLSMDTDHSEPVVERKKKNKSSLLTSSDTEQSDEIIHKKKKRNSLRIDDDSSDSDTIAQIVEKIKKTDHSTVKHKKPDNTINTSNEIKQSKTKSKDKQQTDIKTSKINKKKEGLSTNDHKKTKSVDSSRTTVNKTHDNNEPQDKSFTIPKVKPPKAKIPKFNSTKKLEKLSNSSINDIPNHSDQNHLSKTHLINGQADETDFNLQQSTPFSHKISTSQYQIENLKKMVNEPKQHTEVNQMYIPAETSAPLQNLKKLLSDNNKIQEKSQQNQTNKTLEENLLPNNFNNKPSNEESNNINTEQSSQDPGMEMDDSFLDDLFDDIGIGGESEGIEESFTSLNLHNSNTPHTQIEKVTSSNENKQHTQNEIHEPQENVTIEQNTNTEKQHKPAFHKSNSVPAMSDPKSTTKNKTCDKNKLSVTEYNAKRKKRASSVVENPGLMLEFTPVPSKTTLSNNININSVDKTKIIAPPTKMISRKPKEKLVPAQQLATNPDVLSNILTTISEKTTAKSSEQPSSTSHAASDELLSERTHPNNTENEDNEEDMDVILEESDIETDLEEYSGDEDGLLTSVTEERNNRPHHSQTTGANSKSLPNDIVRTAILHGDLKTVIECKITLINDQLSDGDTLLMVAVNQCAPDMVQVLLEKHANPNKVCKSGTPLMVAVELKQKNLVCMLLKNGAALNTQTSNGETALIKEKGTSQDVDVKNQACKLGFVDIMHELMNYGADIQPALSSLEKAIMNRSSDLICPEYLLTTVTSSLQQQSDKLQGMMEYVLKTIFNHDNLQLTKVLLNSRCISPSDETEHEFYFDCDSNVTQSCVNVVLLALPVTFERNGFIEIDFSETCHPVDAIKLNDTAMIPNLPGNRCLYFLYPKASVNMLNVTSTCNKTVLLSVYAISYIRTEKQQHQQQQQQQHFHRQNSFPHLQHSPAH